MATARPSPSRRLPRGRSALDAQEIAGHHRRRLYEAVIALLGEQGYGATTVQELASQAGVSTKDFYDLFAGKQQLVLEACDAVIQDACAPLRARPPAAEGNLHAALAAVLSAVVDVVVAEPAAARLAVVDVVAVGPQGIARRRSLSIGLHDLLRRAATVEGVPVLSEAALTVLAGGTLHVLDGHLRAGKLRPLRNAAQELAAWGALYETGKPRALPGRDPLLEESIEPVERPLPRGRHSLPPGFVRRYQRTRILEAVLQVSADTGFEATSVKDLISAAGLSPQAFYENFASKEEAWAAAFEESFSQLYLAAWRAASPQDDRATQVSATVAACLHYLASEPGRARLLLVDAPSAGRVGAPAIEQALRGFEHLVAPALSAPGLPKLLPTAMVGGIAELAAGWVLEGRTAQLPDLTAAVIELILTPTLGLTEAVRAANAAVYGGGAPTAAEHDDRHRLIEAFAEAVARDGLRATRLADVAQEAGIELDVANALFDDELDCATKALDAWAGQLVIIAAGAFLSAAADPPLAAHRALEAALWHIARTPAVAALAVSDDPALARAASGLRERYIALFFQLIAGQVPVAEQRAPQPLAALELVLDGILATLRRFAEEHHVAELPGQLPALSQQCLTPFFGADEARRVAALAAASPSR
jgi:AcrR family transcriptional regulator